MSYFLVQRLLVKPFVSAASVPHLSQMMTAFATIIPPLVPRHKESFLPILKTAFPAHCRAVFTLEQFERGQLVGRGAVRVAVIA